MIRCFYRRTSMYVCIQVYYSCVCIRKDRRACICGESRNEKENTWDESTTAHQSNNIQFIRVPAQCIQVLIVYFLLWYYCCIYSIYSTIRALYLYNVSYTAWYLALTTAGCCSYYYSILVRRNTTVPCSPMNVSAMRAFLSNVEESPRSILLHTNIQQLIVLLYYYLIVLQSTTCRK